MRIGMTPGCRGCSALNRGGQSVNHSEECRSSFEKELEAEGDDRIENEKVKREDALTEELKNEEEKLFGPMEEENVMQEDEHDDKEL